MTVSVYSREAIEQIIANGAFPENTAVISFYDPVCMTGHYASWNARVFESQAMSVVAVFIATLCYIKICVIIQFEEPVQSVCVVIMSMRKNGKIDPIEIEPHLLRVFRKQRRETRIKQHRLIRIFDIERKAPFTFEACSVVIIYKNVNFH